MRSYSPSSSFSCAHSAGVSDAPSARRCAIGALANAARSATSSCLPVADARASAAVHAHDATSRSPRLGTSSEGGSRGRGDLACDLRSVRSRSRAPRARAARRARRLRGRGRRDGRARFGALSRCSWRRRETPVSSGVSGPERGASRALREKRPRPFRAFGFTSELPAHRLRVARVLPRHEKVAAERGRWGLDLKEGPRLSSLGPRQTDQSIRESRRLSLLEAARARLCAPARVPPSPSAPHAQPPLRACLPHAARAPRARAHTLLCMAGAQPETL